MRRYSVSIDDRAYTIDVVETAADRFEVSVDGVRYAATLHGDHDLPGSVISPEIAPTPAGGMLPQPNAAPATTPGIPMPSGVPRRPATPAPTAPPPPAGTDPSGRPETLSAPMPGVVLELLTTPGARVERGDPILVLEAMKMRNTIRSPRSAVVVEIAVAAGQPVRPGDPLVRLGDASP